jgi:hypothetical protein
MGMAIDAVASVVTRDFSTTFVVPLSLTPWKPGVKGKESALYGLLTALCRGVHMHAFGFRGQSRDP